ncbi:fatty acid synthase-like [Linepithema humile]|uniref:fatty acid synthase-like n=1 Tax=Linepithema humile TaxID=83485 RepID=UPI00351DB74E
MVKVALNDEDYEYMSGHVIDGRQLLPATGYLMLVWETMTTGKFQVIEGDNAVVTGTVREPTDIAEEKLPRQFLNQENDNEEEVMNTKDIYKELRLRGYQYAGMFRGLKSSSTTGKQGHMAWMYNWVTFMDNMLQMKIFGIDTRSLYVPTGIQKLSFLCVCTKSSTRLVSGGVEIRGIKATSIFRRKLAEESVLKEYRFIAHRDRAEVSLQEAVMLSTHLSLEYHQVIKVNIIELIKDDDNVETDEIASPLFIDILGDLRIQFVHEEQEQDLKRNLRSALQNNGFLLTREQSFTKDDIATVEKYNLAVVLEKRTHKKHNILLKKREQSTRKTQVIHVNNYEFSWLEQLKSTLNAENESRNVAKIILVSEKDSECLLDLVNCLRRESSGESIRGVFIQDETAPEFSFHELFYAEQLQIDLIINVLRPSKTWGSYRHLPLAPLTPKLVYHALANQLVSGDLSLFRWIEGPITPDYKENNLVHIAYSTINFRDVMIAAGKLVIHEICENVHDSILSCGRTEDCKVGIEYVGVDNTEQRVMGLCDRRSISNMCTSNMSKYSCWKIPDEWSMEDAATVPCAYGTCCYALIVKANMKKSDTVLIHSGTGAVGQVAIHLAYHKGYEIFITVNCFEQMIFSQTNGRGVDIVLNSLAEKKLHTSIRCLAKGGRFLEIGKFDFMADNLLNLSFLSKGIQFFSVMLETLSIAPEKIKAHFNKIMTANLVNKAIQSIARKIFEKDEVEAAFRYMATGKYIGKIIIKIHEENESMSASILAIPRYYCLSNKSYIILGGLGGFGLELADWLVARGAQNLVFISRAGVKNGYQQMKIDLRKSYGVKSVNHIERRCVGRRRLRIDAEVGGKTGIETFQEPFKAKAWATKNLDYLTRKICPQLRHFVVFSSVSCGRRNAGQTNYGMANSIMERICERKVQEGLHGLAVQWGTVGDVADMQENDKEMVIGGTLQQKITSCIAKLEDFLLQKQLIVASMVVAEKRLNTFGAPFIANINLTDIEERALENLVSKPLFFYRYVDDIVLAAHNSVINKIIEVFNSFHDRIKFTCERTKNGHLSFLDVELIVEGDNIIIKWFHKQF